MRAVASDCDTAVKAVLDSTLDAEINTLLDAKLGIGCYFAKPQQFCEIVGWSHSKYDRAQRAGLIQGVPQGSYIGIPRPVIRGILKKGVGPLPKKPRASPASTQPATKTAPKQTSNAASKRRRTAIRFK
jgi:hypothetical protein